MKVTDVKKGHFVFTPRPDRAVSYQELHEGIVKAGYDSQGPAIAVRGSLTAAGRFEASGTRQEFLLSGPAVTKLRKEVTPGMLLTLSGPWRQGSEGESIE